MRSCQGALSAGSTVTLQLSNAASNTTSFIVVGVTNLSLPLFGGILVPSADLLLPIPTGPIGAWTLGAGYPPSVPVGFPLYLQVWIPDATGPQGYTASNAMTATTQ